MAPRGLFCKTLQILFYREGEYFEANFSVKNKDNLSLTKGEMVYGEKLSVKSLAFSLICRVLLFSPQEQILKGCHLVRQIIFDITWNDPFKNLS